MPMHGFSDTMEKHFLIGRDFEVSKKILTVALLFAVISTGFLWADNQVITSSRVEGALAEEMSTQTTWAGYAQQLGMEARTTQADASDIAQMRLMAARGDAGYPVTVGDIYTLSYIYNNQVVTIAIEIGHSPTVNVAGIGSFDTTARTFAQFKAEVEAAVTSRYPYSSPTLTITAVGAFSVHVSGMVKTSAHVEAWGLTRLSDMAWYAMDNASTRDVTVISSDGSERHYDLYAARMCGDSSQDPLLCPLDRIVFNPEQARILVSGGVRRSGTYQLSGPTTITVFLDEYAQGFTSSADTSRISVSRYENGTFREYEVAYGDDFILQDGDSISVPALDLPVGSVTLDGALVSEDSRTSSGSIHGQVRGQYFYRFMVGETIEDMLVEMSPYFTASSDLDGCYLTRDGKSYPISFRNVLYGNDPDGDIVLQNGDRFTIPFSNQVVMVNGAVNNPGTYAYVPGKDITYYVNLAGGLSSAAKGIEKYRLYNNYGERLDDDSPILAETTIEMEVSTFERDLGITVSVVGLVATVLGIVTSIVNLTS